MADFSSPSTWFPVITDATELLMGKRIHRSNENCCFKGTWKKHPEAGKLVIKKLLINRAESLNLFEREVSVLSREELKGHIVMPLAITRARPHYSIVMPYMENGSLEHVLHDRGLPTGFPLALCLAVDAAEALVAVHKAGLIHRDIKAANLLVRQDFKLFLTDFGSALVKGHQDDPDAPPSSYSGPSGGYYKAVMDGTTMLYAAPEVLHNQHASQASDVYSLGMCFAELATGYPPYNTVEKVEADMHTVLDASYSRQGLRVAIVNNGLRPPLRINRHGPMFGTEGDMNVPDAFSSLIETCWSHEPSVRPTAQQVVDKLRALATESGVDVDGDRSAFVTSAEERIQKVEAIVAKQEAEEEAAQQAASAAMEVDTPQVPVGSGMGSVETAGESVALNENTQIGAYATSGTRGADKMEDRHAVVHLTSPHGLVSVCAVFDGHGGALAADYCAQRLPHMVYSAIAPVLALSTECSASRSTGVIKQFVDLDVAFRSAQPKEQSGCTAIALALWETPTVGVRQLLIANAGDCRAVLCRRKLIGGATASVLQLSNDQTAEVPSEIARVQAAGGKIVRTADGRNRVQGHIQVTRSLGDANMKPFGVCADPEITEYTVDEAQDDFVVVATDGVWDVMTNEDVADAVLKTARDPGLAAKRIGGDALARGSRDNISVVVVFLKDLSEDFRRG